MKVAIVKQLLDTFGPWSSVLWKDKSPTALLARWPGKALHWELTTLLQADWYVIPQQVYTDYTYDAVLRNRRCVEILRKYTENVVQPQDIPFEAYDLVITHDPVLKFPAGSHTLFAYFLVEHWDRRYRASLARPLHGADLFLAHMLDAPGTLRNLPQAVAFPYLRDPQSMRTLFAASERDDAVWADWRTLASLSATANASEADAAAAAQRLEEVLHLPVVFRSFSMGLYHGEDPPRWGDAGELLKQLGRQKYYVGLGRGSGAGQGLADAASLGCLCFGEQDKPYHRLLCHPDALCGDLQDLPSRLKRVRASRSLQREIRVWQDEKLQRHFIDQPMGLLDAAMQRKRKLRAAAAPQVAPVPVESVNQAARKAQTFRRAAP